MPDQVSEDVKLAGVGAFSLLSSSAARRPGGTRRASGRLEEILVEGPSRTGRTIAPGTDTAEPDRGLHRDGDRR